MSYTKNKYAFSLVELMVVISIISILTGIAYPRFINLKIQAARIEPQQNLNFIYTLQQSFHSETGYYGGIVGYYGPILGPDGFECHNSTNDLGFKVSNPCKLRYAYQIQQFRDWYNSNFASFELFSGIANATRSKFGYGHGIGFGIPDSSCYKNSGNRYSDNFVINQDKQFGFFQEGDTSISKDDYNAIEHCK